MSFERICNQYGKISFNAYFMLCWIVSLYLWNGAKTATFDCETYVWVHINGFIEYAEEYVSDRTFKRRLKELEDRGIIKRIIIAKNEGHDKFSGSMRYVHVAPEIVAAVKNIEYTI